MAVRTRDLPRSRPVFIPNIWRQRIIYCVYAITILLVLLAGYACIGVAIERVHILSDDLRYGRPRTTHLEGFVGHGEDRGQPTALMAVNMHRQVVLIEIPGGNSALTRVIEGPYLFGADQELAPIELQLEDLNGDGVPELLLVARREQIVYINKDGGFRLPTAAEQAELNRVKP